MMHKVSTPNNGLWPPNYTIPNNTRLTPMIKPNFIPRTLRGVGGVRLYDIPGVHYPKEMLEAPTERVQESGNPYTTVPKWGISTKAAAVLLHCTPAAARMNLQKKKVRFRLVNEPGKVPCIYWDSDTVTRIAEARLPVVVRIPAKMYTADQAAKVLKISRSTLYRYVQKKRLKEYKVRLKTPLGTRKVSYYLKADVRKLTAKMNAIRMHEMQAAALRRSL